MQLEHAKLRTRVPHPNTQLDHCVLIAQTELPVQLPSLKHVRRLDVRNNPLRVPLPREMVVFLHRVQDARYDAHVAPPARANG